MGRKLKGVYRGGTKSIGMLDGEARSRETNGCPLRRFARTEPAADLTGREYLKMYLECGHFAGNYYGEDTVRWLITSGKRMRCRVCGGVEAEAGLPV